MGFFVRLPDGFVPEMYGWIRYPGTPERFPSWVRPHPDLSHQEALTVVGIEDAPGDVHAWFLFPGNLQMASEGLLWALLRGEHLRALEPGELADERRDSAG